MALIRQRVDSLYGGVSQQAPSKRLENQVESADNVWFSPLDGAAKRPPTEHVAEVIAAPAPRQARVHEINRDRDEKYLVVMHPGVNTPDIQVFDIDGDEYDVFGPGATALDASYLDHRVDNLLAKPETFAGPDWTRTGQALAPANTTLTGPLGFGRTVILEHQNSTPTTPSYYEQTLALGSDTVDTVFSAHVRSFDPSGPQEPAQGIFLYIVSDDGGGPYESYVAFSNGLGGDDWAVAAQVLDGAPATITGSVEEIGDGWHRITARLSPSTALTVSSVRFFISQSGIPSGTGIQVYVWGAQAQHTDESGTPDYVKSDEYGREIREATVKDYTIIANRLVTPAMDPTVLSDDGKLGLSDVGYYFVRQALFSHTWTVTCKVDSQAAQSATVNTESSGGAGGRGADAEQIAGALEELINTGTVTTATWTGVTATFSGGNWVDLTATRDGSVLRIEPSGGGATIEDMTFSGGALDLDALVPLHDTVPDFSFLPLTMQPGFKIRVAGDPATDDDDYWVEFAANDPDSAGNYASGHWVESIAPSIETDFDADTMPHQLVRLFDDASGTVTGTPFKAYFEFGTIDWASRTVGDTDSNADPTFIGEPIRDVFFFRGRLGFLTGENVVMSEVNEPFNFWRTTVRTLLDSDVVDAQVTTKDVSILHHAIPFDRRLVLFSDRTQFVLQGDPVVGPKTVEITPILNYRVLRDTEPASVGEEVLFIEPKDDGFSGMRNLVPVSETGFQAVSDDLAQQIPRFIVGAPQFIAASPTASAALLGGGSNTAFMYRYSISGRQRIQSAWSRWVLEPSSEILFGATIDDTLYLLVYRENGLHLEKALLQDGQDIRAYLDRRVAGSDLSPTYNSGPNTTTLTLPYTASDPTLLRVVRSDGVPYTIVGTPTATTIDVLGDATADDLFVGETYTMVLGLTRPYVKAGNEGSPSLEVPQSVIGLSVGVHNTTQFRLKTAPAFGASSEEEFSADSVSVGAVVDAIYRFTGPVHFMVGTEADGLVVTLEAASSFPFAAQSLEWVLLAEPTARAL